MICAARLAAVYEREIIIITVKCGMGGKKHMSAMNSKYDMN